MEKRRISFDDIYPSGPHYSRGVRAGNMLFISGCTANGSPAQDGSPMEQLRVVLDRITSMVRAEGGKPADICKLTMFVADPHKWHPFEGEQIEIYHEFLATIIRSILWLASAFPWHLSILKLMPSPFWIK